jgi:hypothetical protein|tara:strand:- start:1818 stop:2390 length:573 start_codon:yes stop_codon:yes gene_type:complete
MPAGKLVKKGSAANNSVYQMSKTDKGIKYMMGAATPQIGNPGLHRESNAQERENLLNEMPGSFEAQTGLYKDRMNGKLPQNPMLMQYGMDENAVKQVGKHIAVPQMEGLKKKVAAGPIGDKISNAFRKLFGKKDGISSDPYVAEEQLYGKSSPRPRAYIPLEEERGYPPKVKKEIDINPLAGTGKKNKND